MLPKILHKNNIDDPYSPYIIDKYCFFDLSFVTNPISRKCFFMKVFLDDIRPTPPGWERAYWPEEAIELLKTGQVTELSLDHDLGDDQHGTGYDVLLWMEEQTALYGFKPPLIKLHTKNSSAEQKMMAAVIAIKKLDEKNR